MTDLPSRRRLLATGAGAALGLGALAATASPAAASPGLGSTAGAEETRTLDELYQAALAEGGKLVIYAGGDVSTQADGLRSGFKSRFPDIDLTVVVDYSKFHDVRVDNQFATGTLVPDVVQLQTVQDFVRWKQQGRLLAYKPAGYSKVYAPFKDPHGAWVAVQVSAFSYMYGPAAVGSDAPRSPLDLVEAKWKGQIASSYPHDDDAALYLYTLYVEKYGWEWLARLAAQDVQFARGSYTPRDAVTSGQKAIGVGGSGAALATGPVKWVLPDEATPFMSWGQRAAILKQAKHPTAAKLYLNWRLSVEQQQAATNGWSVRTDLTPPTGLKPIWQYPNGNLDGFPRFMADRAEVERWKQTFALYFGEVKGDPSPGWLGLHPGA
ncbi:ABC transporter substrate-binding protein [Streptomyces doebereineriae]|uniref:Extracellular solute-binding protein n=1 Tax=Streptomyces doebereineriae TaxID=3075528 RepID=A0ABU2VEB6_9ACTN|nr:extracellular solute-binding protein [Streptomyces sp. DSM 41640]MDT0483902.1 extracellular solute-binding protein [Streptomyces sp. DSM 41640]